MAYVPHDPRKGVQGPGLPAECLHERNHRCALVVLPSCSDDTVHIGRTVLASGNPRSLVPSASPQQLRQTQIRGSIKPRSTAEPSKIRERILAARAGAIPFHPKTEPRRCYIAPHER